MYKRQDSYHSTYLPSNLPLDQLYSFFSVPFSNHSFQVPSALPSTYDCDNFSLPFSNHKFQVPLPLPTLESPPDLYVTSTLFSPFENHSVHSLSIMSNCSYSSLKASYIATVIRSESLPSRYLPSSCLLASGSLNVHLPLLIPRLKTPELSSIPSLLHHTQV